MSEKLYWHFLPADGRLQYGDRELVVVGERLMLSPDTKNYGTPHGLPHGLPHGPRKMNTWKNYCWR